MLILASASPRRKLLLERVGVALTIAPADVDESVLPDELPLDYVRRVAGAKAFAHPLPEGAWVLAADTTVELGGVVFGKAADADEAAEMLRRLAGHTHHVITAVVLRGHDSTHTLDVTTAVEMVACDDAVIADYVASDEWRDKAGAYAVQGIAAALIHAIHGSITNVIGLPLAEVVALLRSTGAAEVSLARGLTA